MTTVPIAVPMITLREVNAGSERHNTVQIYPGITRGTVLNVEF